MARYKKKGAGLGRYRQLRLVVIEAVRYSNNEYADNPLGFYCEEIPDWLWKAIDDGVVVPVFRGEDYWYLRIKTSDGDGVASPGDYVIKDSNGEISACKPDVFEEVYEEVSD